MGGFPEGFFSVVILGTLCLPQDECGGLATSGGGLMAKPTPQFLGPPVLLVSAQGRGS